ncbi:MAG: hypothetical protein IIY49_05735 [Eubacterium sp.]|nr:hypothetical protein [Eubacterium sp.]
MSQEKVDRYKENKKNRAKILKKKKIKKYTAILVTAFCVGALIGIPVGRGIYKYTKNAAERNKTVADMDYNNWFNSYWNEKLPSTASATSAEVATEDANTSSTTDATATDAQ